jgi:hypothetical protein
MGEFRSWFNTVLIYIIWLFRERSRTAGLFLLCNFGVMRKKKFSAGIILSATLLVAACSDGPYDPDKFLSGDEQEKFIRESVFYTHKLAPNSSHKTKFDSAFSTYYDAAAKESRLTHYFIDEEGLHYFLISRKAKSITPMEEGIGGRLLRSEQGELLEYEELFRTWKMPADTLEKRGKLLFERMVTKKDLTMYYSKFQGDRFIEFPDGRFYFDVRTRRWHDRELDSLRIN